MRGFLNCRAIYKQMPEELVESLMNFINGARNFAGQGDRIVAFRSALGGRYVSPLILYVDYDGLMEVHLSISEIIIVGDKVMVINRVENDVYRLDNIKADNLGNITCDVNIISWRKSRLPEWTKQLIRLDRLPAFPVEGGTVGLWWETYWAKYAPNDMARQISRAKYTVGCSTSKGDAFTDSLVVSMAALQ